MKILKHLRTWHRWLACIIGVQVLIWTLSGLIMSFFPIERVRSEHLFLKPHPRELEAATLQQGLNPEVFKLIEAHTSTPIVSWSVKFLLDTPVVLAQDLAKSNILFNLDTQQMLSPLDSSWAERIARAHYKGSALIKQISKIENPSHEYKTELPAWRVDFDNQEGTAFYISPTTGEVLSRRSSLWRFYDFFWMLHIMDYWHRTNFNSWWLITAASLSILMAATGMLYLSLSLNKTGGGRRNL